MNMCGMVADWLEQVGHGSR